MEELNPKNKRERKLTGQQESIQEIFKLYPELEKIGSQEKYENYLETVFPETKLRSIVWHGTDKSFEDEGFKKGMKGYNLSEGRAFFFSPSYWRAEGYSKSKTDIGLELTGTEKVIGVILDIRSPKETFIDAGEVATDEEIVMHKSNGYDALFLEDERDDSSWVQEYVVFEPEQIHILGSQSDIEKFKEFVAEKTT